MKTALTIGRSDTTGGAGIQGDIKTFSMLGVYGATAITALTVQNSAEIKNIQAMEPDVVFRQIAAVAGDITVHATKSGMLANTGIIEAVHQSIKKSSLAPYVCDPVILARNGDKLLSADAIEAMRSKLFPLACVITPGRQEAAELAGVDVATLTTVDAAKDAARRLIDRGARAVVIRGIEVEGNSIDVFFDGKDFREYSGKLGATKTIGSGSAFSAAITAGLANGKSLVDAIDLAKQLVNAATQSTEVIGRAATSPVNVMAFTGPKKK